MKEKIEMLLYFLTLWLSTSIIVLWVAGVVLKLVINLNK